MTWLRIPPRFHRRAGRFSGDPIGLSRAPCTPASSRPLEAFPRGSRTALARGSPRATPDTEPPSRYHRVARPVSPPSLPINPHTTAPAPRFCPTDL
jgi:hypothetical protein